MSTSSSKRPRGCTGCYKEELRAMRKIWPRFPSLDCIFVEKIRIHFGTNTFRTRKRIRERDQQLGSPKGFNTEKGEKGEMRGSLFVSRSSYNHIGPSEARSRPRGLEWYSVDSYLLNPKRAHPILLRAFVTDVKTSSATAIGNRGRHTRVWLARWTEVQ